MTTPASGLLRVTRVVPQTRDAVSVEFAVPPALAGRFRFEPGQFLTLRIPVPVGGWVARCYSLSSAPGDGPLTITVKRVAGGLASNWICDVLRSGDEIEVLPPAGMFVPDDGHRDLLLFAGGSGITPIMSILRTRLAHPDGTAVLVYANRDEHSVIFAPELRRLAADHPDRLLVIHLLETVQGVPTVELLAALCQPFQAADVAMLCGPARFIEVAAEALAHIGTPREHIVVEKFRSLESDPFVEPAAVPSGETRAATLTVELDGERRTLAWPVQTVLLDLLRTAGMDAPFSCREGACSACACRLVAGEVKLLRNEVLEEEDLAAGYVLACQAIPVTEQVEVTYD